MALTTGINHVASLTTDLDRLIDFYVGVFGASVLFDLREEDPALRHAGIDLGGGAVLHPFEIDGNPHAAGVPAMFGRGHLDHVAVNAASPEAFEELRRRLVEADSSDGVVTDFGAMCTISYVDPDGAYGEVALWGNEDLLPFAQRRQYPFPLALD